MTPFWSLYCMSPGHLMAVLMPLLLPSRDAREQGNRRIFGDSFVPIEFMQFCSLQAKDRSLDSEKTDEKHLRGVDILNPLLHVHLYIGVSFVRVIYNITIDLTEWKNPN